MKSMVALGSSGMLATNASKTGPCSSTTVYGASSVANASSYLNGNFSALSSRKKSNGL